MTSDIVKNADVTTHFWHSTLMMWLQLRGTYVMSSLQRCGHDDYLALPCPPRGGLPGGCLTVFSLFLVLRFHKESGSDVTGIRIGFC